MEQPLKFRRHPYRGKGFIYNSWATFGWMLLTYGMEYFAYLSLITDVAIRIR